MACSMPSGGGAEQVVFHVIDDLLSTNEETNKRSTAKLAKGRLHAGGQSSVGRVSPVVCWTAWQNERAIENDYDGYVLFVAPGESHPW